MPSRRALSFRSNVTVVDDQGQMLSLPPMILDLANSVSSRLRNRRYGIAKNDPRFKDRIRVVAEGDSWFQHPGRNVLDVVDQLFNHYNIFSLAAAGDVLSRMVRANDYIPAVKQEQARVLLISGGGNDLLGRLDSVLVAAGDNKDPRSYFGTEFVRRLNNLANLYRAVLSTASTELPDDVIIVTHGYDYVVPLSGGPWLGPKLAAKGLRSTQLQREAIHFIIDSFNDMLRRVARDFPRVYVVDLRGTVPEDGWYDEIHPDNEAFQQVALKIQQQIQVALSKKPR